MPRKKKKYIMTDEQKQAVDMAAKMIKTMPGGRYVSVFSSLTGIVRIQNMRNEETQKHTRMFYIGKNDKPMDISNAMLKSFEEIRKLCGD